MSNFNLSIILRILDAENKLSERADQKSISLLSILGVFMVFFVVYYRVIPINVFTVIMISLYFFIALAAIFSLIMTIRPRLHKIPGEPEAKEKTLACDPAFFSGICGYPSIEAYKETLMDVVKNEDKTADVYIRQIFSVARINAAKYRHVQRGALLVISALIVELAVIVYLFIYQFSQGNIKMPTL